ncbi:TPA: hypothetical protein ACSP2Y_003026 [Aeromonas veronii]
MRPLGSVEQQQLPATEQQHKAWRLGLGKHHSGEQFLPATRLTATVVAQQLVLFRVAVSGQLQRMQGLGKRIALFFTVERFGNPQPRAAIGTLIAGQQRQAATLIERLQGGCQLITERA